MRRLQKKAIEHICFLVDAHRLYENALGLYNLELALLVAQQSQRDPREYVPFIQDLHKLSELRRKFEIDDFFESQGQSAYPLKGLWMHLMSCALTPPSTYYTKRR